MLHAGDFFNLKFSFRWGDRPQSPEECAATAQAFLKLVQTTVPGFKKWQEVDAENAKAVSLTKPVLTKLFQQGQTVSEASGKPIDRAGYKAFLSSSEKTQGFLGAYLHFGGFGRGSVNVAVLDVYLTSKKARSIFTLARCRKFCEQAIVILQPDHAVLDNLQLYKHSESASSGWLVYLSRDWLPVLPKKLPRGVEAKPYKKLGTLFIAADKSFPQVPPTNLKALQSLGRLVEPLVKPRG